MWSKLHCDYYVELILQIISDTLAQLDVEIFNYYEFKASMANLENSALILQNLIVAYREEKKLPESYASVYSLLVDLKLLLRDCRLDLKTCDKGILYNTLALHRDKLLMIYEQIDHMSKANTN